jgi:hypothetical protein
MVSNQKALNISFSQSLLWIAVLMAATAAVANVVHLLFVEFIHENSHRSQKNSMELMVISTPILAIISCISAMLVFALPQYIQTVLMRLLSKRSDRIAYIDVLLALPLTAVLTRYFFDYLTPTDFNLGINEGPDWSPYQHGLTARRYLSALVFQAPATLFSILYFGVGPRPVSRKYVVLSALTLAIVTGGILGYLLARQQYQNI